MSLSSGAIADNLQKGSLFVALRTGVGMEMQSTVQIRQHLSECTCLASKIQGVKEKSCL